MTERGLRDSGYQDDVAGTQLEPSRRTAVAPVKIPAWGMEQDAWRWVRRFNHRYANALLRLRSAKAIPPSVRSRFLAMGLPADGVDETLQKIRRLDQWAEVWVETAQKYLGEQRRQASAKNDMEGAKAQWLAALCYHAAQIISRPGDERIVMTCRTAAASLFGKSLPYVYPNARKIEVPWRTQRLPGYLMIPESLEKPAGLIVFLNGASTAKEETISWAPTFLQAGLAVLALDSPGTGMAISKDGYRADQDDIIDGVFDLLRNEAWLDLRQVYVAGISMGGNQAIRAAAYDRRIAGVIAVTPPYDPSRWIRHASPLLMQELSLLAGTHENDLVETVAPFSLIATADRVRCPVLIFGAGRDVIVPATESQLLAERLGSRATLVWYPQSGHCLYDSVFSWTSETSTWITALAEARAAQGPYADTSALSASAREALATAAPAVFEPMDLDEFDEGGARLLDPDEIEGYDMLLDDDPDLYRAPADQPIKRT